MQEKWTSPERERKRGESGTEKRKSEKLKKKIPEVWNVIRNLAPKIRKRRVVFRRFLRWTTKSKRQMCKSQRIKNNKKAEERFFQRHCQRDKVKRWKDY